jgi:SH3-like domain-containing protein
MNETRVTAAVLLMLASGASAALEFKNVEAAPAILYDAPSVKGDKLYIAPRGMPVEVVLSYGEWVKVRDVNGDMAWTEAKLLGASHNVIVRSANARVRASADDAAPALMMADKGVLLELLEPPANSWLKVRHKDGITGFIRTADVWGI